jgi:hypothetical protein
MFGLLFDALAGASTHANEKFKPLDETVKATGGRGRSVGFMAGYAGHEGWTMRNTGMGRTSTHTNRDDTPWWRP